MNVDWKDFLRIWWPLVVLFAVNAIGGIFSAGYISGQRSILYAAETCSVEVKRPKPEQTRGEGAEHHE